MERKKLGSILVEKGLLKPEELEITLKIQDLLSQTAHSRRLGELLLALGFLASLEQIRHALEEQRRTRFP